MDKHSIRINGVASAITLEPDFWEEFRQLAEAKGFSLGEMATIIARDNPPNLSSAIRQEILRDKNRQIANLMKMIKAVSMEVSAESVAARRKRA